MKHRKGGTVVPPSDFQSERPEKCINKEISESFPRGCAPAHAPTHTHKKMKKIKVLIACEESQCETIEFRNAGCLAFSCDLQKCSGGHPEWHVQGDVLQLFDTPCTFKTMDGKSHTVKQWDLVIAHPPCTYLTKAASTLLFPGKQLNHERYSKGLEAREFFMRCLEVNAQFVCVENPVPNRIFKLPPPSCYVQPYFFGDKWQKKTLYWLKNLPPLMPTIFAPEYKSWVHCTRGGKKRSKSFASIAKQMVAQWLPIIEESFRKNNKKHDVALD